MGKEYKMSKPKRKPVENQLIAYLKWCKNIKQVTEDTYCCKKYTIRRFVRSVGINDISELTNKKIDWWISQEALTTTIRGVVKSPNSIRQDVSVVIAWIKWCRDMGYKVKVKTMMITIPKTIPSRRKWYTAEDIAIVLEHCDELLDEVIIRVLFDTGLRISEFTNLRLKDIDGRQIYVVGKGNKQGWVYISEATAERLNLWIKVAGVKNYLWIKMTKKAYYEPLTVDCIRKRLRMVFKSAGYPNFQVHELRHSFATDLRRRGAQLDVIKKLMRHSSVSITERYLHNLDGDLCPVWDTVKNYDPAPNRRSEVVYIGGKTVTV